ncbi:MAG: DNA-binding response regulator [Acidobacteria bacterium 13_1_20CM_3_53_8]|nr:MAG: DNA-binding response regulator [Acidobacteria bacterium 13_1_20CM_3_53_8]
MIKLLIADDHQIVREGLRGILSRTPDMEVCAEASSAQETLDLIESVDCDVALIDIHFDSGRSGLDILREIKRIKPKLSVLILSIYPEDQYAVRAIRAGAAGYLMKGSALSEVVYAIRKVYGGGHYVSERTAENLALSISKDYEKPLHQKLSNREYEIMLMIASGKSVREIAEELSRSEKTVRTHRERIMAKMGMKRDAEIIHYAIQNNLL